MSNRNTSRTTKVGIVGIEGKYGQWLKRHFTSFSFNGSLCEVSGSDTPKTNQHVPEASCKPKTNQEVVEESDVVIFSVPLRDTVSIIEQLTQYGKADQLWMDVTSVKEQPMNAMLKSGADVVGLHPMCGPDVKSWRDQVVAVCYEDLKNEDWKTFVQEFLKHTGGLATSYLVSSREHDENMPLVQTLPHALSFLFAATFATFDQEDGSTAAVAEAWKYSTPPFKLTYAAVSRILAGNSDLYIDIQMMNKSRTLAIMKTLQEHAERLHDLVETENRDGIRTLIDSGRKQFKRGGIFAGTELFSNLKPFMDHLSTDSGIIIHCLECEKPGLLIRILEPFSRRNIDLASIHSLEDPEYGDGFRFHITTKEDRRSWNVQEAIKEIRNSLRVVVEYP